MKTFDCPAVLRPTRNSRNLLSTSFRLSSARVRSHGRSEAILGQLARSVGIQTEYTDMNGRRRRASPETLKAMLLLWDIDAVTVPRIKDALRERSLQIWRQPLEPVVVSWDGKPIQLELNLPVHAIGKSLFCRIHFEDGSCRSVDAHLDNLRTVEACAVEGQKFVRKELRLPSLPQGYHELEIAFGSRNHGALIICAPTRSYSPQESLRILGGFLPMYAVHSSGSWGAGTLADWGRLTDWLEASGARSVATLPLLAAFLDHPFCEISPYSPVSRLFWNEFYIDIESTPEFQASSSARRFVSSREFQKRVAPLRQSHLVNYPDQHRLRREVLERMAADFFSCETSAPSARQREFRKFLSERPALSDYAEFRATCDQRQSAWHCWEERMRNGKLQKGDYSERDRDYYLFAQWLAEEQISSFADTTRRRGLLMALDLPAGVNPDGYDLWRERDAFASPACAGAPPDMFFTKGQNWGFPPLHPQRIRQRRYSHMLDFLRFQMRHAGMLRIDHVMGLHRLYWIPPGFPASQGAYVTYPAQELYAILSLESHRHQTVLVGENLGTVPPEVNEAMARHHFRETCVVQYEQRPAPGAALRRPPRQSLASINTHDMPTFRAHWEGLDIDDRAALGLLPSNTVATEKKKRRKLNAALVEFLRRGHWLNADATSSTALKACLQWLAAGPAEVVQVNLEDLWGATEPQNVPGTKTERPNWRRKTAPTLEQIVSWEELKSFLASLTRLREGKRAGD